MRTVELLAPAKINLTLHVTGTRDGYHLLDSLVVFADIGDTLAVTPAPGLSLSIDGPFAEGLSCTDNLVLSAARLAPGTGGAALRLTKRLPLASGIGGGSSDAAAALLALSRLRGTGLPSTEAVLGLGADLPVCLLRRPCRMQGVGEALTEVPDLPPMDILLVNPGVSVPTGAVFRGLERKQNPGMGDLPAWPDAAAFCGWLAGMRNDLYPPAARIAPEIDAALSAIRETGPLFAGMSGSGATCFGLFPPGGAEAPRAAIARACPGWWGAAGRIGAFPA